MRDILFRGQRFDNGEWVYGSLLVATNNGQTAYMIYGGDFYIIGDQVKSGSHALVVPETVGQYTGLTDKNGRKIFEGDTLVINEAWHYPVCVKFTEFSWECHSPTHKLYRHRLEVNPEKYEVIGNIYDNPELLGGAGGE